MSEKGLIKTAQENGVTVVKFVDSSLHNPESIAAASQELYAYVEEHRPQKVIIDFSNVKFFSSQVLGTLLGAKTRMDAYDGAIVISGLNPQLYRVFRITNLVEIFRFCQDKNAAVAELQRK